jgi:hypothetical protein
MVSNYNATSRPLEDAIAAHVVMIADYIRQMKVSPQRQGQLAANVGEAVLLALREMPESVTAPE